MKKHQPPTFNCKVTDCKRHGIHGFYRKDKLNDHLKQAHGIELSVWGLVMLYISKRVEAAILRVDRLVMPALTDLEWRRDRFIIGRTCWWINAFIK